MAEEKKFFDTIAPAYIRKDLVGYSRLCRSQRLIRTLKNIARPIPSLLEVGCGAGFSVPYLGDEVGRYVGIDESRELIGYARTHHGSNRASFFLGDVMDFKSDSRFDVILMIGVLHHLHEPERVLRYLKSLLKPNGCLVANEPQRGNPLFHGLRLIRKRIDPHYEKDQRDFSGRELKVFFELCGFEIRMFPQGFFSTPLAETLLLPGVLGYPLAVLFRVLDPFLERVLGWGPLKNLFWNLVVEARPLKNGS